MSSSYARHLSARLRAVALVALFAVLSPTESSAQTPTPADSAAVLLETARDFEANGRGEVAQALYVYIAERFGGTPAGSGAQAALERWRAARPGRTGRVELQVWGTLYGLWLGVAVPTAFGAEDTEAYGAGILLGAPAGFLAARALTRSGGLSEGQARAITWGGTWGTYQGLGWGEVFDVGAEEFCSGNVCFEGGERTEEQFASMVAGGLVGVVVGGILSRREIDAGVATGAHYGSIGGSWVGLAGSILLGLSGDLDGDDDVWIATLLAGNAGLVGGAWAADRFGLSRDRVRLIGLGAMLGGLGGLGLDLLVQPDTDEVAVGIPFVLSMAGLAVAAHLTRDYDAGSGPGEADGAEALLRFDRDGWSTGVPVPLPTLLRAPGADGREVLRPGLRLTLLSGRF